MRPLLALGVGCELRVVDEGAGSSTVGDGDLFIFLRRCGDSIICDLDRFMSTIAELVSSANALRVCNWLDDAVVRRCEELWVEKGSKS